ncbi:MAG: hypothetical protein WC473_02485 [Patescibacteria group bacterium]
MTKEITETRRISDEGIRRAVVDLMFGWRDPDTWLSNVYYESKKDAAGILEGVDPEYLYPLVQYLGVSGVDLQETLKMVKKYDRTGKSKRFILALYRMWRGLTMAFRPLRGYRY